MERTQKEIPGTTYGLSDSGWIDMHLFKQWFIKHFIFHANAAQPLLLLLDGHVPITIWKLLHLQKNYIYSCSTYNS